jgi:hypothetical protein
MVVVGSIGPLLNNEPLLRGVKSKVRPAVAALDVKSCCFIDNEAGGA